MKKKKPLEECYCSNCGKGFHSLGIARHRAMHRDRKENCKITYKFGNTIYHNFGLPYTKYTGVD